MEITSLIANSPPSLSRLGVVQVIDSLATGGAERFAINLANTLAEAGQRSHLCSTRAEGPLAELVHPGVRRLRLGRSSSIDFRAFRSFRAYVANHRIDVIHAHSTSLYISLIAAWSLTPRIIWHLHQGKLVQQPRAPLLMRLAARRVGAVIAVSRPLADWAIERLRLPPERVRYVANYVRASLPRNAEAQLPGKPGFRIVCVANLRPEKDTLGLLAAMTHVLTQVPEAHLLLVGACADEKYRDKVRTEVINRHLAHAVTFMGRRDDVCQILQSCDVGVVNSVAEGLPLALLEYGAAGLATVSTSVGACAEVLDNGCVGLLVPPSDPPALAVAVVSLLRSRDRREAIGAAFRFRVERQYSEEKIAAEITKVYHSVLPS